MSAQTHRTSLARVEEAARVIDPVFTRTPQFVCEPLSEALGVRTAVKVETLNPVRSFKGRGADLLVTHAADDAPLLCASAGNFGQAMAYACRERGRDLVVYASTHANPLKVERMRALGAEVVLYGPDFDAAKMEAKRAARQRGMRFVEDGDDLDTVEGAATMGLEWLGFTEALGALVIPLGNGAMFNGVARVLEARSPRTTRIAVQAAGAPAMVESWRAGRTVEHDTVATIADGIGIRIPVRRALEDMRTLVDEALLVSEAAIIEAMRMVHRHVGVVVEPAGAVGVAALLEHAERFHGTTVGTILCGGNLTEEQMRAWLAPS